MTRANITRRGAFAAPLALAAIPANAAQVGKISDDMRAAFARWRFAEIAWNDAAEKVGQMLAPNREAERLSDLLYHAAGEAHDALSRLPATSLPEAGMHALAGLRSIAGEFGRPGMPSDPLEWTPAHFSFAPDDADVEAAGFRSLWAIVSASCIRSLADGLTGETPEPVPDPIFAAFDQWRDARAAYARAIAENGDEGPEAHAAAEAEEQAAVALAQTMPTTPAGVPVFVRALLFCVLDAKGDAYARPEAAEAGDFIMPGGWLDGRDRLALATALRFADDMARGGV